MSTIPCPGTYPFAVSDAAAQHLASAAKVPGLPVRRRASADQARAIEKLGHAVDYLIYSRMFLTDPDEVRAEADAIHIMMMMRRSVFQECERVVLENHHLRRWVMARLERRTN